MKRLALIATLLGTCLVAGARERCTTQSIQIDGQLVNCMVCCDQHGNCNTSCWR